MKRLRDNTNDHIVSALVPIAPILARFLFAEECGVLRITCKALETLPPFRNATPTPTTFLMKICDEWSHLYEKIQGSICTNGHPHIRLAYHIRAGFDEQQWRDFYVNVLFLHIRVSHISPTCFKDVYGTKSFPHYTQMGTKPLCYLMNQMQKFGSSPSKQDMFYDGDHCHGYPFTIVSCWAHGRKCANPTHGYQCWNL